MISLLLIDGSSMTYNSEGVLQQMIKADGCVEMNTDEIPRLRGLWHDEDKITVDWEDVVELLEDNPDVVADFVRAKILYLDNGQVVSEGQIRDIWMNGSSIVNNGGCDTSGWENTDDNVYCECCEVSYQVIVPENMEINRCIQCGGSDILLREDN